MENKFGKIILAIAIGGVAVWMFFKAKQALAAPEKVAPVVVPERPVEPKQPKWQITADQVCYRSGDAYACIPNILGGLFKIQDQVALETVQVKAETSIK